MVSTEEVGDIFLLRVDAVRLDSAVGTIIRNTVVSKLDTTRKFALDIGAVKLVDSGGLGSLVALLKNITNHQGKLAVVGMNKSVRMMFELSRMDRGGVRADQCRARRAAQRLELPLRAHRGDAGSDGCGVGQAGDHRTCGARAGA